MRDAFSSKVDTEILERRIEELHALQKKQAWENIFFRRGATPGISGSTGPRDRAVLTPAQEPPAKTDKTDPTGGSSMRSLSREVVDRVYETAGKASDGTVVKSECDPDNKDTTPGEDEQVDWGGPTTDGQPADDPNKDDPKTDDSMKDAEADDDPDDEQIRKLLRNRPPSLVLLAAHRMIGICGSVGEHTSIEPADAPDWSTERVGKLIEDIIDTCENTQLLR